MEKTIHSFLENTLFLSNPHVLIVFCSEINNYSLHSLLLCPIFKK